ncbi:MAG: cytochrome b/b6 domain-containing protein [Deltaproteobacteria bacterium]|nr:cytochrome b/b6 domain-containing protein [Deltaproteobacteria bacterium]
MKVWDVPTRLFHWSLVALVATGALTGLFTPEWWMGVHVWAGYGMVGLITFRIVWGVFGPEYSRVVSFVYPPRSTLEHMRGLLMLRPPHYVGHNPTGALMVFALAGVLIALVTTGLLALGGEEKQGPLALVVGYSLGSGAKRVHHALTQLLLLMSMLHVAGVVTESVLTGDNLVRAIVTGWKTLPPEAPHPTPRPARPWAAAALTAALAGCAALGIGWVARQPPPHGLRAVPRNATYDKECGTCHDAHAPSLLPAASWAGIMLGLQDHFGEDASLPPETTQALAVWLVGSAAETFDTEAANRFRTVAPASPHRITATPYWVRKHAEIAPAVFKRERIKSRVNCSGCHRDASSGRFDDQAITIPEG